MNFMSPADLKSENEIVSFDNEYFDAFDTISERKTGEKRKNLMLIAGYELGADDEKMQEEQHPLPSKT